MAPAAEHSQSHSHSHSHDADGEVEYTFVIPEFSELDACLKDEQAPISKRMRTVFLLKQLGTDEAVVALTHGLKSPSVLLSHECAYVLGQMQSRTAIPALTATLKDTTVDPVTRHECAEALAAINDDSSLALLDEFCNDPSPEVADTCKIAVEKMRFVRASATPVPAFDPESKYASVDPAPPLPVSTPVAELKRVLNDRSLSLFERYRAMFALRNVGTEEAIDALTSSFQTEESSAVFRHEIAYVLGQMQHPHAIESLSRVLSDRKEHAMVRHEAAEAIGSIAEEDSEPILKQYEQAEPDIIVRQSCEVALDLCDYWNSTEVCTAVADENAAGEKDEDDGKPVNLRSLTSDVKSVRL